ncbi:MAG: hypothetical protein HOQ22_16100 [Nocardioidaceae bacterium]|nr:hypothetical protein [Nocardioidaceae bacterium]NUS52548.1 hypothetical protein [Nocardioidaceae bacterium]
MSDVPPPAGPAPYGPPPRKSHWPEIIGGGFIGGFDAVVSGAIGLAVVTSIENGLWFFLPVVIGLLIPVVLLANAATRWWGVGILIGFFLTVIVLGGACVAIIASFGG